MTRNAFRTAALAAIALATAGAGCGEFLENPVLPTSFGSSIHVLDEGSGQEWGQELFPVGEGDRWLYLDEGDEDRPWMTWQSADTVEINGRPIPIWKMAGESFTLDAWTEVTDDAVRDFGSVFALYACGVPRLHFPLRPGKRWETDCSDAGHTWTAAVKGLERLRTDVGWFDAVRVEYGDLINGAGEPFTHTWWFVPGVGVVQREYEPGRFRLLRYASVAGRDVAGDLAE